MAVEKFMEKNNVIRKRDFECYEILLPFSAIAGKRKKQFLSSELEKLHPCFSDEFTYDTYIKKIQKKGICENVLVMNKYKLAEYEGKRAYSGTGFRIESEKQKRFFVSKKWKSILWTIAFCLFIGVIGIISGVLAGRKYNSNVQSEPEMTEKKIEQNENEIETTVPITENFIDAVKIANGKISGFEWNFDGFSEKLKASVSGVFPEALSVLSEYSVSDGVVQYENGIPQMQLFYSRRVRQNMHVAYKERVEGVSETKPLLENADFNKILRDSIIECGGVLREEKAPPYHIEFSISADTEKIKLLLEKISDIILEDNRIVTNVFFSPSGSGKNGQSEVRLGLSIEPSFHEGFNLKIISGNLNLFIQKSKNPPVKKIITKNEEIVKTKIGEIKRSDNSVVVFYKNAAGKMEMEVQNKGGKS